MNLTQVITVIINEMKIRLGLEAKRTIARYVNEKSKEGFTALHYASYRGNIDIINKLIENSADIEVTNFRGLNVLHMAAQGNHPSSLVYFKDKYFLNIQSIDEVGSTPLHWACYTGSEISVMYLLSWGANVNVKDQEGLTPLHLAVMSERTRIIKKLLQKGADKSLKDLRGRTPFDLASVKNKIPIMDMLKERTNWQLCAIRAPLQKTEKSRFNIIFFFFVHLFVETAVIIALLPCPHIYIKVST